MSLFGDIKSERWLIVKGFLFLLCGCFAVGLVFAESPTIRVALLLAIGVWCFARFYYFAFYVIEHYIDDNYRFAGLSSAIWFLIQRRASKHSQSPAVRDD